MKRIIIGISGASGSIYGVRLLQVLQGMPEVETHLVLSQGARVTLPLETEFTAAQVEALATVVHDPANLAAPISSGSFPVTGMVVAPCSMKSLAQIALSLNDNLLSRAADVT
ncbi:MAG: UbiX family flavin prenyltransferase, partial [Fluviibacter sp.]